MLWHKLKDEKNNTGNSDSEGVLLPCTWSDIRFRGKVTVSVKAYRSCARAHTLADPFRPACEWQGGLCKEPQRGLEWTVRPEIRSAECDTKHISLTSRWHPLSQTHTLSVSALHARTHKHARRECRVCERLSVSTADTDHLGVNGRKQQRETEISREGQKKEGRAIWDVCLPENLSMSHRKWLSASVCQNSQVAVVLWLLTCVHLSLELLCNHSLGVNN